MESKLLDMRDCARENFAAIHGEILRISLGQQRAWFRPMLVRSAWLRRWTGYDHWSRRWEYPWAIQVADLGDRPLRVLDVGGGGSPFAPYLASRGHECFVADPSLDAGAGCVYDRQKSLYRNARSLAKKAIFKAAGIHSVWGLPDSKSRSPVHYLSHYADDLRFPDAHFHRVFCLSVIEHIPQGLWTRCMREFQRVLRPGGRLVVTQDMTPEEANRQIYLNLVECCSLTLVGSPRYDVPMDREDQRIRHPGQNYETIGLVWQK